MRDGMEEVAVTNVLGVVPINTSAHTAGTREIRRAGTHKDLL
jgi:hypothetical protein